MPVRNWIPKEAQMLVILADMISLKKSLTKEIRNRRTGRRKGPFLNKDFRLKKLSGQQRKPRMPAWGLKKATHLQNDMCHSSLILSEDIPKLIELSQKFEALLYNQTKLTPEDVKVLIKEVQALMLEFNGMYKVR